MRIKHDSEKVAEFSRIMLTEYYEQSKRRTGFHRSDSIGCPLRTYWRFVGGIEPSYTTRDVGTLLLGTLAHVAMHKYFDYQEKIFKLGEIYITVDALYGKYPIETKTTRKKIYRKEQLLQSWIEQLAIAMSVMGINKGYLMVMNIISFGLTVWEVTMTDAEREMFAKQCLWQILLISEAIKEKDPSKLTPKTNNCGWCPYKPTRGKKGCPYYVPYVPPKKKKK